MKKYAKRIPGTLDTSSHTDFGRKVVQLSPEPYLDELDIKKVGRLVESGHLSVFRQRKCKRFLCDFVVPDSASQKLYCSKSCWEKDAPPPLETDANV